MSITSHWDNPEQTILVMTVDGNWTLDDYYDGFQQGTIMMNSVNHKVILILDLTTSSAPPTRFLSTGRYASTNYSRNRLMTIMVGTSNLTQLLLSILQKLFPQFNQKVALVETVEEARLVARQQLATRA